MAIRGHNFEIFSYCFCLCFALDFVFCVEYGELGKAIILTPDISFAFTEIAWKLNDNKVLEYDGSELKYFGTFRGRTELDYKSGALTIKHLQHEDSGKYVADIVVGTFIHYSKHEVEVKDAVPKPDVTCKLNSTSYRATLQCAIEPPMQAQFEWSGPKIGTGPELQIEKQEDPNSVYTCIVKNEVSSKNTSFTFKDCNMDRTSKGVILAISLCVFFSVLLILLIIWLKFRRRFAKNGKIKAKGLQPVNEEESLLSETQDCHTNTQKQNDMAPYSSSTDNKGSMTIELSKNVTPLSKNSEYLQKDQDNQYICGEALNLARNQCGNEENLQEDQSIDDGSEKEPNLTHKQCKNEENLQEDQSIDHGSEKESSLTHNQCKNEENLQEDQSIDHGSEKEPSLTHNQCKNEENLQEDQSIDHGSEKEPSLTHNQYKNEENLQEDQGIDHGSEKESSLTHDQCGNEENLQEDQSIDHGSEKEPSLTHNQCKNEENLQEDQSIDHGSEKEPSLTHNQHKNEENLQEDQSIDDDSEKESSLTHDQCGNEENLQEDQSIDDDSEKESSLTQNQCENEKNLQEDQSINDGSEKESSLMHNQCKHEENLQEDQSINDGSEKESSLMHNQCENEKKSPGRPKH